MKRPPWERYWPRNADPRCGVCDEDDPWKLRYYAVGFRCSQHAPGVMPNA